MATHVVSLLTDVRSDKRADVPIAFEEDGEAVENEDDGERNELHVSKVVKLVQLGHHSLRSKTSTAGMALCKGNCLG